MKTGKKQGQKIEIVNIRRQPNGTHIAMLKWGQQYVVAYNFDYNGYRLKNDFEWQQGYYFSDKEDAFKKWNSY